jgi:hypothetical protein
MDAASPNSARNPQLENRARAASSKRVEPLEETTSDAVSVPASS